MVEVIFSIHSLQLLQIDSKTYVISSRYGCEKLEIHSLQKLQIYSKKYVISSLWLKKILRFIYFKCLEWKSKIYLPKEDLSNEWIPLSLENIHNDIFDKVEVLKVGTEDDEVESGHGLQLPGLRVNSIEIL